MATINESGGITNSTDFKMIFNVPISLAKKPELPIHKIFNMFINPTILILGLFLNVIFILVSSKTKAVRSTSNIFLINLAIADIFFLLFGIGEQSLRYLMAGPEERNHLHVSMFGSNGCSWYQLVTVTTHFSTLFLFTLVTFDRLYCIRNVQKIRIDSKRKHFLIGTVFCWLLAAFIAITFLPTFREVKTCGAWNSTQSTGECETSVEVTLCEPVMNKALVRYRTVMKVLPFFLSALINFPLYIFIVRHLKKTYPHLKGYHGNQRQHTQITKMLIFSGISFFFCLFPYQLEVLYEILAPHINTTNFPWRTVSLSLVYFHSVIGPLIYVAASSRYRVAFKEVFQLSKHCRNSFQKAEGAVSNHISTFTGGITNETHTLNNVNP